jgi:hypothetical protein
MTLADSGGQEELMERGALSILGLGLVVVWVVGLAQHVAPWLVWLDGIAGLLSIVAAGSVLRQPTDTIRASAAAWAISFAVTLGVFFILALRRGAPPWLTWVNLAFACAYLLAGLALAFRRTELAPRQRSS